MTISNTTEISPLYSGNGATTAFATGFKFLQNTDPVVLLIDKTTGVETTQVITTNYTITGAGVSGGGTVTFLVAPTSNQYVKIVPGISLTQAIAYQDGTSFPATSHETALDKLTLITQQLDAKVSRAPLLKASSQNYPIVFPDGSASNPNMLIGYDATGVALTTVSTAQLTVSGSLTSNTGVVVQTAPGAFTARTITGTANQITVTNGSGIGGNPTISLPTSLSLAGITSTGGTINYPTLTTYDNTFTLQNFSDGTKQAIFSLSGITTGTTRTLTVPNANGTLALAPAGTGLIANNSGVTSNVTITGTVPIAVTNGSGSGGNPTISLDVVDLSINGAPSSSNDYIVLYNSGSTTFTRASVGTVASATSIPDVVYAGTYMALTTTVI